MTAEILNMEHGPDIIEGHLGGCSTGGDGGTYYPIMWERIVKDYDVNTVLDVGCGRGFSSKYFQSLGCDILGIDGSTQAEETSLIPEHFLLNDYEGGPALSRSEIEYEDQPIKDFIFDLCWCCEFVEHVWEEYSQNFIDDFKQCRYVAMTYAGPGQSGHHHVNCQPREYWVEHMSRFGFEFDKEMTDQLKELAGKGTHYGNTGLFFRKKIDG